MPSAAPMLDQQMYPLQDMHQQHVEYLPLLEAQNLLKLGFCQTYGTKKRIVGVRLTVPLSQISEDTPSARALMPATYAGKRWVLKEPIDTPTLRSYIFRLAKVHVTESPEHALLRIMTPPALEASYYRLRWKSTEREIQADPGNATRRNNRNMFSFGTVSQHYSQRRHSYQETELPPNRDPLKPPVLGVSP